MELKSFNYKIINGEIDYLDYEFSPDCFCSIDSLKKKTKEGFEKFEKIIEESYGETNFSKQLTRTFSSSRIEAGFEYRSQNDQDGNSSTSLIYDIQSGKKFLNASIKIFHINKETDITLKMYEKIKGAPGLKFNEKSEKDIKDLDYILGGGFNNNKYPGLMREK